MRFYFLSLDIKFLSLTMFGKIVDSKSAEDQNQLKVVVQVGYNTVKKKDATGAVTVLTAKDFNKGPVTSADQMIQGEVAGFTNYKWWWFSWRRSDD
jgi:outer membrane receptor for ferrienterochelin and colicin